MSHNAVIGINSFRKNHLRTVKFYIFLKTNIQTESYRKCVNYQLRFRNGILLFEIKTSPCHVPSVKLQNEASELQNHFIKPIPFKVQKLGLFGFLKDIGMEFLKETWVLCVQLSLKIQTSSSIFLGSEMSWTHCVHGQVQISSILHRQILKPPGCYQWSTF